MNSKVKTGIFAVLGSAAALLNPLLSEILGAGIWIYLVRMVRKEKNDLFKNRMGAEAAEKHLKKLKAFLKAAAISFLIFIAGAVMHNVLHGRYEIEENFYFFTALAAHCLFVITIAGGLLVFLKGRQKPV